MAFARLRKSGTLAPQVVGRVSFREPLQDDETGASPGIAEPVRRRLADPVRLPGRDQPSQRGIRGGVFVHRDRRRGRLSGVLARFPAEVGLVDQGLEKGDALVRGDTRQPENLCALGIDGAVLREGAQARELSPLEPREEKQPVARVVVDAVVRIGVKEAGVAVLTLR